MPRPSCSVLVRSAGALAILRRRRLRSREDPSQPPLRTAERFWGNIYEAGTHPVLRGSGFSSRGRACLCACRLRVQTLSSRHMAQPQPRQQGNRPARCRPSLSCSSRGTTQRRHGRRPRRQSPRYGVLQVLQVLQSEHTGGFNGRSRSPEGTAPPQLGESGHPGSSQQRA